MYIPIFATENLKTLAANLITKITNSPISDKHHLLIINNWQQ